MHDVALDLLILLAGIWLVAVTLRPLGLPTIMGELIVGVLVGPAVFGLIEPSEAITLLADIGIFFLMFHAGVETQPTEFFDALKRSLGLPWWVRSCRSGSASAWRPRSDWTR